MPSAPSGAGALIGWMILSGKRDALNPILDTIRTHGRANFASAGDDTADGPGARLAWC